MTSASLAAVCAMMFTVAGRAVTADPVTSMPAVRVTEHPWKRHSITDLKERELMLESFEDWWASRRSTPRLGRSSALQLLLVTHPVVPVPGPSSAFTIPAAGALPVSSWSVASSSCSTKRHCSRQSPGPRSAPAPPAVPYPALGSSWAHKNH